MPFARNTSRNIGKILSSKYSQKLLDHAKQSALDPLKTASKRAIQQTAKAAGDLIGNKIGDRITKDSKTSRKNNSETNEEEVLRERFVHSELRHKITDDLKLKEENY